LPDVADGGRFVAEPCPDRGVTSQQQAGGHTMHGIIYIVGLVVVVLFVLSLLGLR
jgi:hypothetical protein